MAMIKIGSEAPTFSLPNQDGKLISLSDFLEKKFSFGLFRERLAPIER